jgi:hypothetical protein
LIVGPNRVILQFEPENVNSYDFKCQFMAFGSGFECFEMQKTLRNFNLFLLILGAPYCSYNVTGVACWKGLPQLDVNV